MLQLCGVDAASRHTTGCTGLTTDRTFRVAAQSRDGVVDAAPGLEAHRRLHWCQPRLCAQCWRAPATLFSSHEWSPRLLAARGPARGRPEPALAIWLRWAVQTMCVLPHALGQTAVCPSPCAHCLPYKHAALLLRMSPAPPTGTNCVLCGTVS